MEDRRRFKRAKIEIDVEYQISKRQESLYGRMIDISCGGICLISKEAFGVSNSLELRFLIPDAKEPIDVTGIVRWEDFDIAKHVYLIGIQLDSFKEKYRALIEKFVEQVTFVDKQESVHITSGSSTNWINVLITIF